ncbi:MAG: winged helix-turn-helix domain-containing protein [Thermomicrobiales bacterium]
MASDAIDPARRLQSCYPPTMNTPPPEISISNQVARQFLLGRQGLWPGRRWRGKAGTRTAIETLQSVQMDPVTIVARSHDLALWNRVEGYQPQHLQKVMYDDRNAFDYGGVLSVLPTSELPHWRLHMERRRSDSTFLELITDTGDLPQEVMALVEQHGPLSAKEVTRLLVESGREARSTISGSARGSYRSKSAAGRVVYQLWLTGELMTHHRDGFERVVDLVERVDPQSLLQTLPEADTEHFFALKALRRLGLATLRSWRNTMSYYLNRSVKAPEGTGWLAKLVDDELAVVVDVEGHKSSYFLPAEELKRLRRLRKGAIPGGWTCHGPSTSDEVRLLSPLDHIASRERAQAFFGFEQIWEIYKPAPERRYGPYTMPLLFGDELVGRVDPRLDRATSTMHINGIWLEDPDLESDESFMGALSAGLRSFATFHEATSIEVYQTSFKGGADHLNLELA